MADSMPPPTFPSPEDVPLFAGYEPPPADVVEEMSADQRRTRRQATDVQNGIHPLTRGPIHPLASRHRDADAPKDDPFTCGSCYFRETLKNRSRAYPKCTYGLTAEMKYLTDSPRISSSAATDVRAWWPACRDYSPGSSMSPDAARSIPAEVNA